jgi:hypothetical protein
MAASALYNNRDKYPLEMRKSASTKILSKASSFKIVYLPHREYLEQAAG